MFCIYGPNGQAIDETSASSRQEARKNFAQDRGTTWGPLWDLGYRCRRYRTPHVERTTVDDLIALRDILDAQPVPAEGREVR